MFFFNSLGIAKLTLSMETIQYYVVVNNGPFNK